MSRTSRCFQKALLQSDGPRTVFASALMPYSLVSHHKVMFVAPADGFEVRPEFKNFALLRISDPLTST